jgi:hypothetical protein
MSKWLIVATLTGVLAVAALGTFKVKQTCATSVSGGSSSGSIYRQSNVVSRDTVQSCDWRIGFR